MEESIYLIIANTVGKTAAKYFSKNCKKLFNVNTENTRTMSEIYSTLTTQVPMRPH